MPMLLQDKVALITGAGNGIGRATAIRFAKEGTKLVISDLDEVGMSETRQQIESEGGEVSAVVGSVASRDDAQKMVDTAVETYGTLHILINNAGIARDGLTTRMKD